MRIAAINHLPYGAPLHVMQDIANAVWLSGGEAYTFVTNCGHENLMFPGREYIGTYESTRRHMLMSRHTGVDGIWGRSDTRRMLARFDELGIELINLHNMLWSGVHLPMLFRYAEEKRIPIVWTLHGCWPFTGKCPHFVVAGCDRWKTGCHHCPQLRSGPECRRDNTALMWRWKRDWFADCRALTIIGSSNWVADRARESFLAKRDIRVIHYGINLHRFMPVESDFRQAHHLEDKTILLGVADNWLRRKGLSTMIELARRLDGRYQVVLVGTNEAVDALLPPQILSIHRLESQVELAKIYSAADIFIQPSQEETFGLVNVEALACGTPVITYDTGGCPDAVDETCGRVIPYGDLDGMIRAIESQRLTGAMSRDACLRRSRYFDVTRMGRDYMALFSELIDARK